MLMSFLQDRKDNRIKLFLSLLVVIIITLAVKFDYSFYERSIATITSVSNKFEYSKTNDEGKYNEKYYSQKIEAKVRNGVNKGKKVTLSNTYASSEVYDLKYKKGDDVFIEKFHEDAGVNTATLTGLKRDYLVALALALLCVLFVAIGGRDGTLTLISLIMNLGAFYGVLLLYFKGFNIVFLTIPMIIFFTFALLVFLNGVGKITWTAFFSSILVVLLTGLITYIVMLFSKQPDYDFLEYLIQPYVPSDARRIFLSETLVSCMGAVMDVSIAVIITLTQIFEQNKDITDKKLFLSSKNVGDDVVGTMIPVMFFTNIATDIPFFILSLRNTMTLHSILKHHIFFASARFLTGSIAIVLAVPISAAVTIFVLNKRRKKSC